jgi:hypothetical protein
MILDLVSLHEEKALLVVNVASPYAIPRLGIETLRDC